nr:MAG TPA: hypothetical protein [Caudoviricetes sp.]
MKNNILESQKNKVGNHVGSLKSEAKKWGVVGNDQKKQR